MGDNISTDWKYDTLVAGDAAWKLSKLNLNFCELSHLKYERILYKLPDNIIKWYYSCLTSSKIRYERYYM